MFIQYQVYWSILHLSSDSGHLECIRVHVLLLHHGNQKIGTRCAAGLQPQLFKSTLKQRERESEVNPYPLPRRPTNALSAGRKRFRRILPVQFTGPPECLATGDGWRGEARRGLSERFSLCQSRTGLWEVLLLPEQQNEPGLFPISPLLYFHLC